VSRVIRYGSILNTSEGKKSRLLMLKIFTARLDEKPNKKLAPRTPNGSQRPKETAARAINPFPLITLTVN